MRGLDSYMRSMKDAPWVQGHVIVPPSNNWSMMLKVQQFELSINVYQVGGQCM